MSNSYVLFKPTFFDKEELVKWTLYQFWGPFLESPGNFSGPELYFKIKIYGKAV